MKDNEGAELQVGDEISMFAENEAGTASVLQEGRVIGLGPDGIEVAPLAGATLLPPPYHAILKTYQR